MAGRSVLVVEDERKIADVLAAYLRRDGFAVSVAHDGQEALAVAQRERPDLVLLDLNLPEIDGLEVARRLRQGSNVPIIMVTARDEETDKLLGLELGADDYVTKPFSPREVVARVKAVLRRSVGVAVGTEELVAGDLVVDPGRHEVRVAGRAVPLTPTEFRLLEVLAREPGRAFSREQLVALVQGYAYEGYDRTIDAHIKNLRQKVEEDPQRPRRVVTVFGVGYKLQVE